MIARTFSSRSIGHDCAANRRAPVTGWLKIVRGAWNGMVECNRLFTPASGRPASPAAVFNASPGTLAIACSNPVSGRGSATFAGSAYVAGIPVRVGSVVRVSCIHRSAVTPSIIEWWILL